MRLMTGSAAIPERGCMQDLPGVSQLCLIAMAFEAGVHRIRTNISGISRCVWIMAAEAVSQRARMLDFRALDLLRGFSVALNAKIPGIRLSKNDLAILRRLVADAAHFARIWTMRESLHQFRPVGLMRGMTAQTIGAIKRLRSMGFHKDVVFYVMASYT